jgi:predicted dehydrogenase
MASNRQITIGVIGSGWIVRPHVHALHTLNHLNPLPARVRLKWIYGRRPEKMAALAHELEIERSTTDWLEIIEDPEVDVVANAGAHPLHAPVSIAAIEAGKHILCEKPLAVATSDAVVMADAAARSGVLHACGFNYRFVPAIRLAHQLLAEGRLGAIRHYRGLYLQDWLSNNPDFPGVVGGSAVRDFAHLFDMVRHFAGEPLSLIGTAQSILTDADDTFLAGLQLRDGATASLEASSCATGWKARHRIEINGTEGSLWWDMEDFNKLHVMFTKDQQEGVGGFREVLMTEKAHPFLAEWWEAGHTIGWESTFVHEWRAFLQSVLAGEYVDPLQATFHDGLRANELGDAVLESARTGQRVDLRPTTTTRDS